MHTLECWWHCAKMQFARCELRKTKEEQGTVTPWQNVYKKL